MRLSRFIPRFTLWCFMIAIAIMGVVLGYTIERQNRFRKIAAHHRAEFERHANQMNQIVYGDNPIWRRLEWHEKMRVKYERAARYPWLFIEPDPPAPMH